MYAHVVDDLLSPLGQRRGGSSSDLRVQGEALCHCGVNVTGLDVTEKGPKSALAVSASIWPRYC